MQTKLTIMDSDKDRLEVKEVGGFGEKMLFFGVYQEDDVCAININTSNAVVLRDYLTKFIEESS